MMAGTIKVSFGPHLLALGSVWAFE